MALNFVMIDGKQFVELAVGGSDAHYRHVQSAPASTWVIFHNLGKRPAVSAFDTTGKRIYGTESHVDNNTTHYSFSIPMSGEATLN